MKDNTPPIYGHRVKIAYTRLEVAELLSVSLRTIDELVTARKIKFFRIRRAIRFTEENIREFIEENQG
jgi:excisionase family DNA binding protein